MHNRTKASMAGFRDFTKEYLMIVLSILTALGMGALIEHLHHAQDAESASQQIEAELREDLAEVSKSLKADQQSIIPLSELNDAITLDIHEGLSKAVVNQDIKSREKQFKLNLDWPTLNNQAWDVAVANQSVTWMSYFDQRRFSTAYTALRAADTWLSHAALIGLNASQMLELQTRLDLGVAVDPIAFTSILRQMMDTNRGTQARLIQIQSNLTKALSANPTTVNGLPTR